MATIIPISTTTTIAICVQIHVGDTPKAYLQVPCRPANVEMGDDMVWA